MSIVNSLKNVATGVLNSNADIKVNTGCGNSNISVTGKNISIDTGCGNQNITAIATGDLAIDTGLCGEDKINALVSGNAKIATKGSDDFINLSVNGSFDVSSGVNYPDCCTGKDDDIVLIKSNRENIDLQNFVSTGDGSDNVRIIANNVDFKKDDGNLVLGFYGDNYQVNSNADNNKIGFWGDDTTINITGSGNQDIKTLDFSFANGEFTDFGFEDLLLQDTYRETTVDVDVKEVFTGKTNIDEVSKEYGLTAEQTEKLKSLDLTKKLETGHSYYVLYKDKGSDSYEIGVRDGYNRIYNEETGEEVTYAEMQQSSYTYTTSKKKWYGKKTTKYYQVTTTTVNSTQFKNEKAVDVQGEKEVTTTTTTTDHYDINGVKNVDINILNDSQYNINLTANEGDISIYTKNSLDNGINNILVRNGYELQNSTVDVKVDYVMEKLNLTAGDLKDSTYSTSETAYLGKKTKWAGWAKVVVGIAAATAAVVTGGALIPLATSVLDAATLTALNLKALSPIAIA